MVHKRVFFSSQSFVIKQSSIIKLICSIEANSFDTLLPKQKKAEVAGIRDSICLSSPGRLDGLNISISHLVLCFHDTHSTFPFHVVDSKTSQRIVRKALKTWYVSWTRASLKDKKFTISVMATLLDFKNVMSSSSFLSVSIFFM